VVTLNVTDAAGNWAVDEMVVTVRDTTPPAAVAGPDVEVDQHTTVRFDGGRSSDNVAVTDWTWTFTYDGEDIVMEGPTPRFTFDLAGEYVVTLNITDASGNWAVDERVVTVRDVTPPTADAGEDASVGFNALHRFDGRGSSDDVGVTSWTWTLTYQGHEMFLYGATPVFNFEAMGEYLVRLNVSDAAGNWAADWVIVTVSDLSAPLAEAGHDLEVDQHTEVELDGTGSTDDVGIVNWTWTFLIEGEPVELVGPKPTFSPDPAGWFVVTLEVRDAAGHAARDTVTVTVRDSTPPVAEAGPDVEVDQHETVTLFGGDSRDNVGVVEWRWVVQLPGHDLRLPGPLVEWTPEDAGSFMVTLTVEDAAGNTASDTRWVTVRDSTPPVAEAGRNVTIDEGGVARFDGGASEDNVGVVEWRWTFDYGGSPVEIQGRDASFAFDRPGTYVVTLEVEDAAGLTDTDVVTVTVVAREDGFDVGGGLPVLVIAAVVVAVAVGVMLWRRVRGGRA